MFQTINPATGEVVQTYNYMSLAEIDQSLAAARASSLVWKKTTLSQRESVLRSMAARLRENQNDLAQMIHLEMGKKHSAALAEIEKSAFTCEYFASRGSELLRPQRQESSYKISEICFEPLGVVLSIMPWNFPVWQFIRFAAPAILSGNVILLKHANITAGCATLIEKVFKDLFSTQLIFNLRMDHAETTRVIRSPVVQGVTFTGSTGGGREVAKVAGEALKKTVLELGGSDAYIVLPDADLEGAARMCVAGRMVNNGQSCIAVKRVIVCKEIFESLVPLLKKEMSSYAIEALAHLKFQSQVQLQVEKLMAAGGRVLLGGSIPERVGAFYPPTLIVFDEDAAVIHEEEIFGPVLVVIKAASLDDAFVMANASPFGLGGGLFSKDEDRAKFLALKKLDAGFVVVNDFVKSDPRLPFGGVKDSGYGRELSVFGLYEFCNIKTVAIGELS